MDQVKNFKNNNIQVELGTDHQKYLHKTVMLPETRLSLIKDFD